MSVAAAVIAGGIWNEASGTMCIASISGAFSGEESRRQVGRFGGGGPAERCRRRLRRRRRRARRMALAIARPEHRKESDERDAGYAAADLHHARSDDDVFSALRIVVVAVQNHALDRAD